MDASVFLFGADSLEHVVAVEPAGDRVLLYVRDGQSVRTEEQPFRPWLYARGRPALPGAEWQALEAPEEGQWLDHLALFPNWDSFQKARWELRESGVDFLAPASAQRQFLTATGITLFKGLNYSDLHRLQLDLETGSLYPTEPAAEVLMVALTDNRGFEECVQGGTEKERIERAVTLIMERDPDVIEGHNLFDFDLNYLSQRAEALGVSLRIGRNGSALTRGQRRRQEASSYRRETARFYLHGRHFVDTLLAAQRYDFGRGEMTSYGLKAVAQTLGVAEPERIIVDRSNMTVLVREQPEMVREYALQDVRETRAIADLLCATDFYQTQMVPDGYQNVSTMGMGEKINTLMHRAYLAARHAIPMPSPTEAVAGGYTEVRRVGVLRPVVKADAQSLYPSIMDVYNIAPSSDKLGVFLPMLRELTRRRIDAKTKMRDVTGIERTYWDGLQSSFKVLINSFYGYLGTVVSFNDPKAAGEVTGKGQEIVKQAAAEIERLSGQVIEIDTDGIYFVPPIDIAGDEAEEEFVAKVAGILPKGIHLVRDGSYRAMISLKVKNYVLQKHDGELIFHGAAVRSRADEPFGREFIEQAIRILLEGPIEDLTKMYQQTVQEIMDGKVPAEKLARRERVTEKTFRSSLRKRSKAAAQTSGAKVGDYVKVYQATDGSLQPLDQYANDEDRDFYLDKLYKFAVRLRDAIGDEFDRLIASPKSAKMTASGQQSLFDP